MSVRDTGDPWLNLWAAAIRQAIRDAQLGNKEAAVWLWTVAPTVAAQAVDVMEVHSGGQQPDDGGKNG